MTSSSINGNLYLIGGIITSIAAGFIVHSVAWAFVGIGATFISGSLIAAFLGNGGEE